MTPNSEIYCEFDLLHEDNLQSLPLPQKLSVYEKYLDWAVGYFKDDCYKDLTKRTNLFIYEYNFLCDGENNEFELDPIPDEDVNFYIGIRMNEGDVYTEITEYTYDEETHIISTSIAPKCNAEMYICTYRDGGFDEDLDEKEISILATGMLTCFNIKQMEKQSLLQYNIFSNSTKAFSKAEHIKAVAEMKKTMLSQMKSMINEYSFKRSPDKLYSLGGRDYMYNHPYNDLGW